MNKYENEFYKGLISKDGFLIKEFYNKTLNEKKWIAVLEKEEGVIGIILTDEKFEEIDYKESCDFLQDEYKKSYIVHVVVSAEGQYINFNDIPNKVVFNKKSDNILYSNTTMDKFFKEYLSTLCNKTNKKNNFKECKVTYIIIMINVIIYMVSAIMARNIASIDNMTLVSLGARFNYLIDQGEIWRFITCNFLHGDLFHIGFNMMALNIIGKQIEVVYGWRKYLGIYFVSSIGCSLLSYMLNPNTISIGASGAVFGLLAATLYFAYKEKSRIGNGAYKEILQVLIINVVIGLTIPNIDMYGHIGGFIGGGVMAFIYGFSIKKS